MQRYTKICQGLGIPSLDILHMFAQYFTHGLGSTEGANVHYDYNYAYLSTRCVLSCFPGKELEKKIKKSKGKVSEHNHLRRQKGFDHAIWINMVLKLSKVLKLDLFLSRGNEGSRPERT